MDIAKISIEKKVISWLFIVILAVGGYYCFDKLGKLEDPAFTIKDAIITTAYPGASPEEVENEITDPLEIAIQQMAQVDEIKSKSTAGVSQITVTMKDIYDAETLPQVWDILRQKVSDAQSQLPPGAGPSMVNNDYGDVYGIFLSLSGTGYSYDELKDVAKELRKNLSLVDGVAKVALGGVQPDRVFVEVSNSKLTQSGYSADSMKAALSQQNSVSPAGDVRVGDSSVRISTKGVFDDIEDIKNTLIGSPDEKSVALKYIADVHKGYDETPNSKIYVDQKPAITLGISATAGQNIIEVGHRVENEIKRLTPQIPAGMVLTDIYYQPKYVADSINNFMVSLLEAIVIVIVVLLVFMGLRSGILIGAILLLTVSGTFIFMYLEGIELQRISLGALIIAMGMLVDNAIVVAEGILVRTQQGQKAKEAATIVVKQTFWPLLGATWVGILAFAGIGLSDDSTGEFTGSLFWVILISLLLSWVLAVTITPFLCDLMLKPSKVNEGEEAKDPYDHFLYNGYKKILMTAIKYRKTTLVGLVALLISSVIGFGFVKQSFFPDSTTPMFYVDYWKPQGTDIRVTEKDALKITKYVQSLEGVTQVSTFVGQGATRFMLVYGPEQPNSSYAQLIIQTETRDQIPDILANIKKYIEDNFPDSEPRFQRIQLGPGGAQKLQTRVLGEDPDVLRQIAEEIKQAYIQTGKVTGVRDDWRQKTKIINPTFLEAPARNAGLTREDLNNALELGFSGTTIGTFRDGDNMIPIVLRLNEAERNDISTIQSMQIWSNRYNKYIPLEQIIDSTNPQWENSIIERKDRTRTITVGADPIQGANANKLFYEAKPLIEAIKLPPGYSIEWGGEYEDSSKAQESLFSKIPSSFGIMILVCILLFNGLKQPLIIWLCVPLALIGVTYGLLLFQGSFGFMSLIGFLSLAGMLLKNAIVLVDQIDLEISEGKEHLRAVVESAVSRVRPVSLGTATTILGMIPLLGDAFFVDMAITIMCGLAFATVLTLVIVPVLYTIFFRIKYRDEL